MKVLDLFSGIGGFSLGLESTGCFETVAFCEKEEFCRRVLKKHWPDVPIWEDIHDVSGFQFRGIDLICGGFPCQPVSLAGKRKGNRDDRWLWPEFFRVIREAQPTWCLIENVPGLRTKHADEVLSDLEGQGYTYWPLVVGAVHAGAPHRRQRVWIVAYAEHGGRRRIEPQWVEGRRDSELAGNGAEGDATDTQSSGRQDQGQWWGSQEPGAGSDGAKGDARWEPHEFCREYSVCHNPNKCENPNRCWLAKHPEGAPPPDGWWDASDTTQQLLHRTGACSTGRRELANGSGQWDWSRAPEPVLRGVDDGVPCGVDRTKRLKALGNAVVPQVVAQIGYQIAWSQMLV